MAHAANGGLQRHSVGELYPWIIVGTGDGRWYAMNGANGKTSGVFDRQDVAVSVARIMKGWGA